MPDGLSGEEQAIYFSKVRKFFDSYACSRVMERRKKMSEHLTDTNVGNTEYIRKQDAIEAVRQAVIRGYGTDYGVIDSDVVYEVLDEVEPADVVQVCRCKDCIHNNDCDIQYSAQAGDNFFCGFGETEKDVREDVYD